LKRIESNTFSHSNIESIIIPQSVEFIHPSAFSSTHLKCILVEAGCKCYRVDDHFLVDIVKVGLIHGFDIGNHVVIPCYVKILVPCSRFNSQILTFAVN
jgi:hypothetical protein